MDENLKNIRHSLAHLLAAAVKELYPDTKLAIGPAIDTGFYYDFEFSEPPSEKDLPKIEEKMRKLLPNWDGFQKSEEYEPEEAEKAKENYKDNPYKQELIDEIIAKGEKITFYKSGDFVDLCRGGHVSNPASDIDPDSFKLTHIAGAYWRGDEKNQMLTRIYGAAFNTKKELDEYLGSMEEAKKRDHRVLGKELDLFTFSGLVGTGLPMFTPKGVIIRNEIEKYLEELQIPQGYEKVWIPHLAKKELYQTSGHWDKFGDDIFHVSSKDEENFVLKPMNCPHHTQIYASHPRSYRDLPIRYFEVTEMYRDEKPGQLQGLTRVRAITIDDAHCFCRPDQIKEEVERIYDITERFYKTFGMKLIPRLSLRDSKDLDKYIGEAKKWDEAEDILRSVLKERVDNFEEHEGEAAFYGPKIDFETEDVLGRKWQLATIQLDFAMPERFGLEYVASGGEKKRTIMIHRAISGSLERFMAILIEHFAGAFPLWLSPTQALVLPVSDKQDEYGKNVLETLRKGGIRCEISEATETIGKRIRQGELEKIPYILVVGEKEQGDNSVTIRKRKIDEQKIMARDDLLKQLQEEITRKVM